MKLKLVKKMQTEAPTLWGLLDTQDNVWMGTDIGPNIYTDYSLARIAAEIIDVKLGQELGRTRATEYRGGANHLRDEVKAKMSSEKALQLLESGYVC